jgi:hypothetical protein
MGRLRGRQDPSQQTVKKSHDGMVGRRLSFSSSAGTPIIGSKNQIHTYVATDRILTFLLDEHSEF